MFSWKKWLILKKILLLDLKNDISIGELARLINIEQTHPYFNYILTFLRNKEVIINTNCIGRTQFLKINKKKLLKIVVDSEYYLHVEEVIKYKNPIWYNT